jgi:CheY-like chemotaxis protein
MSPPIETMSVVAVSGFNEPSQARRGRFLPIEADRTSSRGLHKQLQVEGHPVTLAVCGEERLVRATGERFDLVFADFLLAGALRLDCREMTKRLMPYPSEGREYGKRR